MPAAASGIQRPAKDAPQGALPGALSHAVAPGPTSPLRAAAGISAGLHTLHAAIEDVYPPCGRELCALARVNITGGREPSRSSDDDFPRAGVTSPPTGRSGSCNRPAGSACVDRRRSAVGSAFKASGPLLGI